MFAEIFSLKAISAIFADVAAGCITEASKEYVKSVKSKTQGSEWKRQSFDLFQSLERVNYLIDDYIINLRRLVDLSDLCEADNQEAEYYARCADVHASLRHLLELLRGVSLMIDLNFKPALDIHQPELRSMLRTVICDRSERIPASDPLAETIRSDEWQKEFDEFVANTQPKLRDRLAIAEQNRLAIQLGTEQFRKLLASEFSFKESFI